MRCFRCSDSPLLLQLPCEYHPCVHLFVTVSINRKRRARLRAEAEAERAALEKERPTAIATSPRLGPPAAGESQAEPRLQGRRKGHGVHMLTAAAAVKGAREKGQMGEQRAVEKRGPLNEPFVAWPFATARKGKAHPRHDNALLFRSIRFGEASFSLSLCLVNQSIKPTPTFLPTTCTLRLALAQCTPYSSPVTHSHLHSHSSLDGSQSRALLAATNAPASTTTTMPHPPTTPLPPNHQVGRRAVPGAHLHPRPRGRGRVLDAGHGRALLSPAGARARAPRGPPHLHRGERAAALAALAAGHCAWRDAHCPPSLPGRVHRADATSRPPLLQSAATSVP